MENEKEDSKKQTRYFDEYAYFYLSGLEYMCSRLPGKRPLPINTNISRTTYQRMYDYGRNAKECPDFRYPNPPEAQFS